MMVLEALKPEALSHPSMRRSRVKVSKRQVNLVLWFEASDTSALRAAINSYLRWIMLINESIEAMQELDKK